MRDLLRIFLYDFQGLNGDIIKQALQNYSEIAWIPVAYKILLAHSYFVRLKSMT